MNPALKSRLLAAASGGAVAIALTLGAWYEGDGPTVRQADGSVLHRVYIDPAGIPTVCRGVTGPDVIRDHLYTRAECDVLERKHLAIAEAAVDRAITVPLTTWQRAALIDFAYNAGGPALAGSTAAKRFNARDYAGGCQELTRWVKARVKGQLITLNGLVDRRGTEAEICLHGAPAS